MKICSYILKGTNQNEISTEIKFLLASARFDGVELMRFIYETNEAEGEAKKLHNIVIKVLRSLRSRKNIQFFVLPDGFAESTTEAEFLLNKYPEHFSHPSPLKDNENEFYIKI